MEPSQQAVMMKKNKKTKGAPAAAAAAAAPDGGGAAPFVAAAKFGGARPGYGATAKGGKEDDDDDDQASPRSFSFSSPASSETKKSSSSETKKAEEKRPRHVFATRGGKTGYFADEPGTTTTTTKKEKKKKKKGNATEGGPNEDEDEEEEEEDAGAEAPRREKTDAVETASGEDGIEEMVVDADDVDLAKEEGGSGLTGAAAWSALGLHKALVDACLELKWSKPTAIQREAIPPALQGRDVIGLAETGSGKTGAFALPMLHKLLEKPTRLFGVALAPTRELAVQIHEVFDALGKGIGLRCVCVVGGIDMVQQAVALAKMPHVVVATPGRLVDHLENTRGFTLRAAKCLVMDEADRMLSMDFEKELIAILGSMTAEGRSSMLFSATMTSKVAKLQKAALVNPIKISVSDKFATPRQLIQQYLFIPAKYKDCYLAYVLHEHRGQTTLIFAATCQGAQRLALVLRNLGFDAVCLHGQMAQPKRLGALRTFKAGESSILVATDVASRGLDIPSVDLVLNYDIPSHGKEYIHRVGRTARAGRAGRAVALVTQYDVELFQRLEHLIGFKLPQYAADEESALVFLERVGDAQRLATTTMRDEGTGGNGKGRFNKKRGADDEADGDDEVRM